ncbi:MAG: PKD domain-containing protein, partial [Candidatus Peribacteraceae bacterium]
MPNPSSSIDGIAPPPPVPLAGDNVPPELTKRMKRILIVMITVPYVLFVGWCIFLLAIFPNRTGAFQQLLMPGAMSCLVAALILLGGGAVAFRRILRKGIPVKVRSFGALRAIAFIAPGLILCGVVPVVITGEPPLGIDIIDPVDATELIAPLPVTFSVQKSVEILQRRGLQSLEYAWDFDGDGEENDRTVVPTTTALFDRSGAYTIAVVIYLSDGTNRVVRSRLAISQEQFSVSPQRPGVDEPVRFSVAHLVEDPEMIQEVQWDFDEDGIIDVVTDLTETAHTYLRTGKVNVTALVKFENQTQKQYARQIEIYEPQSPPFPVVLISEPENLISPAPFGTIFHIESEVPIADVIWDFGDGDKSKGMRVGHNFQRRGVYQVKARVHSEAGEIAELSKVVRVVETLKLPDLKFEGTPEVNNNYEMRGGVPVNVNILPRTTMPLIDFTWE